MKNNVIFVAIVLVIFSISCKRESFEPDKYWGEASAIRNGSNWKSSPSAGSSDSNKKFFISFTYSEDGVNREELIISKIPFYTGTYHIRKNDDGKVDATLFTSLYGDDLDGYIYNVSESDSLSSIVITRIENEEIWGTFEVTLLRDTTKGVKPIDLPDTLTFTNGKFYTKILE